MQTDFGYINLSHVVGLVFFPLSMGSGTGYSVKLILLDKLWLEDKTEANAVFSSEHPDHHTWVYILMSTSDVAWVTSSSAARVMRIGRNMIEKDRG